MWLKPRKTHKLKTLQLKLYQSELRKVLRRNHLRKPALCDRCDGVAADPRGIGINS
jgi:hypothetical protein